MWSVRGEYKSQSRCVIRVPCQHGRLELYKRTHPNFHKRLITVSCRLRGRPGCWQRSLEPELSLISWRRVCEVGACGGPKETKAPLRIASRATFGAPLPPAGQAPSLYCMSTAMTTSVPDHSLARQALCKDRMTCS